MRKRRAPKELQRYVVWKHVATDQAITDEFKYFKTLKEARAWAKSQSGDRHVFKIDYSFKVSI